MRNEQKTRPALLIDLGKASTVTRGSDGGARDMITPKQPGGNGISND
jgi:hypothetical protein